MPERKKIAAIVTTYFQGSHADLIASKFLEGFPTVNGLISPSVDLVSIYMDQVHGADVGMAAAQAHGITVYPSIRSALTLVPPSQAHWPTAADWQDGELAVDGILLIGEHGDYARNEKEQRLYPRRHFFEQICGVFASSDRSVPVFNDKHLAFNWRDAMWMYTRAQELGVPFMAGSSLPVVERSPELEHEIGATITDAVSVGYINSYVTGLDSYGSHALETLQCMIERRSGGETGIAAVQCLEGDAVWTAGHNDVWSRELAEAAVDRVQPKAAGHMEDNCTNPAAFLLDYSDGLRATVLLLPGHLRGFGYAARANEAIVSTGLNPGADRHQPFSYLGLNVQEMFLTGEPQYPVERTLLVTGALEALMESRHSDHARIETPHLNISYSPFRMDSIRPRNHKM